MHGIESAMPDRSATVVYRRIGGHDFESTYIEVTDRFTSPLSLNQPASYLLVERRNPFGEHDPT